MILLVATVWLARESCRPKIGFTDQPLAQPERIAAAVDRIDPNSATEASLIRLYRIGPARAGSIIQYRNQHGPEAFKTAGDLTRIKGIGPATVSTIASELSLPN